jgi:succinyl-CoA synthetase beta subunit
VLDLLLEPALKARLAQRGVATPRGTVVRSVDEVGRVADQFGLPLVVKALGPVGDRGRIGLVRVAHTRSMLTAAAEACLNGPLGRVNQVRALLLEELIPPGQDHYVGVAIDHVRGRGVLLTGVGGSGIEERGIDERTEFELDGPRPIHPNPDLRLVTDAIVSEFLELRARLVEVNPVRMIDGRAVVLDAKAVLDPTTPLPVDGERYQAIARQSSAEHRLFERNASIPGGSSLRYAELGGDVGLITWGGGASAIVMDRLRDRGLRPANFADLGGGAGFIARLRLVAEAVVTLPLRGLFIGSTILGAVSALELARVIHEVVARDLGTTARLPIVARLGGPDETQAKELIESLPNAMHVGRETPLESAIDRLASAVDRA